jgi:hypothetical protein
MKFINAFISGKAANTCCGDVFVLRVDQEEV